ncbi:hypothetical protein RhiTH_005613 [Rhizoctonia solani]
MIVGKLHELHPVPKDLFWYPIYCPFNPRSHVGQVPSHGNLAQWPLNGYAEDAFDTPKDLHCRTTKVDGSPLFGRLSTEKSYLKPTSDPASGLNAGEETRTATTEPKVVITGLDALSQFHKQGFLPYLIDAAHTPKRLLLKKSPSRTAVISDPEDASSHVTVSGQLENLARYFRTQVSWPLV